MSGFLWLISEMLLLLTVAAAVFFTLGWRWRSRHATAETARFEKRLDDEALAAKLAREERDAALHTRPDTSLLEAELSESQARQLSLERELLRLRDAKLEVERELQATRQTIPPTPIVEAIEPPQPAQAITAVPDDLTRIRGIGPVLKTKLAAAGFTTFHQIATLPADAVADLDARLKLRGRILRDAWSEQARLLHQEKYGTLPS
jgi:predicted flap endonuclease-1-like 5' DNA nuclease